MPQNLIKPVRSIVLVIVVFCSFVPRQSIAVGGNVLVVVTTSAPDNTKPKYHKAALETYQYGTATTGAGQGINSILAQDGQGWQIQGPDPNPSYPPITAGFQVASDLKQVSDLDVFKNSTSTLMLFVGHGGRGNSINPEDSEVLGWGTVPNPTFKELKEQIKNIATPEHPVRIVCLTCYGGGIHSISQSLDLTNVCSVATAPYVMTSISSLSQSKFNVGFIKRLSGTKSHTFAEAAIAGFRNDGSNLNLGQLSSFDYLDKIFKRGPYNEELIKEFEQYKGLTRTEGLYDIDYAALDMYDRPGKYRSPPPRTLGVDGLSCKKTVVSPSDQFLTLVKDLQSSENPNLVYRTRGQKRKRKEDLLTTYSNILEELKKIPLPAKFLSLLTEELKSIKNEHVLNFGDNLESEITEFRSTETEFYQKMSALKLTEEQITQKTTPLLEKRRTDLVEAVTKLHKQLRQKEKPTFRFSQTLSRISDLNDVLLGTKGTEEEKNKLLDLLKCEWNDQI